MAFPSVHEELANGIVAGVFGREWTGKAIVKRSVKANFRQNDDLLRKLLDIGSALTFSRA